MRRRDVLGGVAATALIGGAARDDRLAMLESRSRGRLGVAIVDTGSGRVLGHRADERFPMCSSFKVLAAAFALARVDRGVDRLDRPIAIPSSPLLAYSPVTDLQAGGTMRLDDLCAAAVTASDNTAANLLLASFGGPAALTGYLRSIGDGTTRMDRTEPALNEAVPGDPRDTSTPRAMVATLNRLVLQTALLPASRARLVHWMVATTTGDLRLRAGLPRGWRVGDKTGTSDAAGTSNDVAVVWPPDRAPLIVVAYLTRSSLDGPGRDAILAEVGRIVAT